MKKQSFIIIVILLSLIACHSNSRYKKSFSSPDNLNDGWKISDPEKVGFDQQKLEPLIADVSSDNSALNSLVIAKEGQLIVDVYFNGYSPDSLQKIWSITKSITGAVLGIAVDRELLSEKDSIHHYLSDYISEENSSVGTISIEHLITMTSGLKWVELGGPNSAGFQLPYSNDWIEFTLKQAHTEVPGTSFNYSTGNSVLLAPIIKKASGQQAHAFANDHLFLPLGITNYEWDTQSEFWTKTQSEELPGAKKPTDIDYQTPFSNFTNTGSGLRMRPRDLCKIGQLYLNKGRWQEKQIISEKWVHASTQSHFGNPDYGYLWRLMNFQNEPCYYATGFGLQRVFVFPIHKLIVVMTQQHYTSMPQGIQWTNRFLSKLLKTINK